MNDDEATIHITLAVGCLEVVRYYEEKLKPKGTRARALNDLIDRSLKVCDLYRVEAWNMEKQAIASKVLDKIEALVKRSFTPPKLVGRDDKGRFTVLS